MDENDDILKELLSELNDNSVDTLFSEKVVSKIDSIKIHKANRKEAVKPVMVITSVIIAFVAMIYIILAVYFKIDIIAKMEGLSGNFVLPDFQSLSNIWQNGGALWFMIGVNALILLILQSFLSKKLSHYNETKSMSSSENSPLKA